MSLAVALWAGQEKPQKKEASEETGSLIRKELLINPKQKLRPPRRNIFTLRRSRGEEAGIVPVNTRPNPQEISETAGEESSKVLLNIRYIGHIRSDGNIVALIIFEDAAFAVEKGEIISEGIQVGTIHSTFIEIIGPDSVKRKFALEGERE
jgi:hypothetical protein